MSEPTPEWRPLDILSRETVEALAGPDGRAWFEVRWMGRDDVTEVWALWFDIDDQLNADTIARVNRRLSRSALFQRDARPLRLVPAAWPEGA